jgi:hypothetical protein
MGVGSEKYNCISLVSYWPAGLDLSCFKYEEVTSAEGRIDLLVAVGYLLVDCLLDDSSATSF